MGGEFRVWRSTVRSKENRPLPRPMLHGDLLQERRRQSSSRFKVAAAADSVKNISQPDLSLVPHVIDRLKEFLPTRVAGVRKGAAANGPKRRGALVGAPSGSWVAVRRWGLAALASCDEGAACRDHADDGDDQGHDDQYSAAAVSARGAGGAGRTGGAVCACGAGRTGGAASTSGTGAVCAVRAVSAGRASGTGGAASTGGAGSAGSAVSTSGTGRTDGAAGAGRTGRASFTSGASFTGSSLRAAGAAHGNR